MIRINENIIDEYNKRCDILKNLIISKYKNTTFEFVKNIDTLYIEVIINNDSKITLLPNNTWGEVTRHIDKKIKGFEGNCPICFEKMIKAVSCNKCSNNFCSNCYIKLFKVGNGIITCPHCRHRTGIHTPEHMINECVLQIKHKLKI